MKLGEFNENLIEIGRRYEESLRLRNKLKVIKYDDVIISLTLMKK